MASDKIKLILLGSAAVGKTSIIQRFLSSTFKHDYRLTVGVDIFTKEIEYKAGKNAIVSIWDMGGQERFDFIRINFFKKASGALLVFDLTDTNTWYSLIDYWYPSLRQFCGNIPFILVGNKVDLIVKNDELIDQDICRHFAEEKSSIYIETSAWQGKNIEESFLEITRKIIGYNESLKFISNREDKILNKIKKQLTDADFTEKTTLEYLDSGYVKKGGLVQELSIFQHSIEKILLDIFQLTNLKSLSLVNDEIDNIPEEIGNLECLEILNLSTNFLSSLPNSIGQLEKLKILILYDNKLQSLPLSISQCTFLHDLDLQRNFFEKIPDQIKNLINLEILHIGYNNLTIFPQWIFDFNDLKYLNIKNLPIDLISSVLDDLKRLKEKKCEIECVDKIKSVINPITDLHNLITLIHFSDLHFGNLNIKSAATFPTEFQSYYTVFESYLKNFIKTSKPQVILISGDIGSQSQFPDSPYFNSFLNIFNPIPILICNGNHDLMREKIKKNNQFEVFINNFFQIVPRLNCHVSKDFKQNLSSFLILDKYKIILITLNTCKDIEEKIIGQSIDKNESISDLRLLDRATFPGEDFKQITEEINSRLKNKMLKEYRIFIVQHHPFEKLENPDYFEDFLMESNVKIVFSGHTHNNNYNPKYHDFTAGSFLVRSEYRKMAYIFSPNALQFNEYQIKLDKNIVECYVHSVGGTKKKWGKNPVPDYITEIIF